MRHVRKGSEPPELAAWNKGKPWRARPAEWCEFPSDAKTAVRDAAASDQGQICCYCCATIGTGACHVEHFRPQSAYPRSRYDWSNLLASCQGVGPSQDSRRPAVKQRHCGQSKGDWFDAQQTVDPQRRGVENLFRFLLNGEIHPVKNLPLEKWRAADETIKRLNLNSPSLIRRRQSLLEAAAKDVESMYRADWDQEYLQPSAAGALQEFWPALKYNFEKAWRAAMP